MRTGIDLGIYGQAVRRYSAGEYPWSFIKARGGFNLLGDHFSPIVAIIAPFYRLWPSVDLLLIFQAAAIGIISAILGKFAMRMLDGSQAGGAMITFTFGLSWGIAGLATFDFHEICLGLPFLAISLTSAAQDRWTRAVLWATPLFLVKEDCAFLIAGLGIACLMRGSRRLGFAIIAVAGAGLALLVYVVIPHYSYYGRYTYLSATSMQKNGGALSPIIGAFDNFVHAFGTGQAIETVCLAVAVTAGMCLRSSLALAVCPLLVARFASSQTSYWGPIAHYNATLMVVVFVAALDAVSRTRWNGLSAERARRIFLVAVVVFNAAISSFTALGSLFIPSAYTCDRCASASELLGRIPTGASVIASTYLIDQLVDRTDVHLLARDLKDSTGHTFQADWVALDVRDRSQFASTEDAIWYGLNVAQVGGYVPVLATTTGYVLLKYDPAAASTFMATFGAVSCVTSPDEVAICSRMLP